MKVMKFLFAFLIVVSLSTFVLAQEMSADDPPENYGKNVCTDSDGGKNYATRGTTSQFSNSTLPGTAFTDHCKRTDVDPGNENPKVESCDGENCVLIEYYCSSSTESAEKSVPCPTGCSEGKCIEKERYTKETRTEQVACMFKGAAREMKCYSHEGEYSCVANNVHEGVPYCIMNVTGTVKVDINGPVIGEKIKWKSSCGGYQYTVTDGDDETVTFDCLEKNISSDQIKEHHFRKGYWKCYDGTEEEQGGETSCKPAGLWQKYAKEYCENHCSKENGKCGVASFAVAKDCYVEEEANEDVDDADNVSVEIKEAAVICKDSCPFENKCYPFGYRKGGQYCSDSGSFVKQLEGDIMCENNFECGSNVCISGKCVDQGLANKVINWFKRLFSKE